MLVFSSIDSMSECPKTFYHCQFNDAKSFLITSSGQPKVVFEAFEASPKSEDVLATQSALQWDFPGCAMCIEETEFFDDSFQHCLATFLEVSRVVPCSQLLEHTITDYGTASQSRIH